MMGNEVNQEGSKGPFNEGEGVRVMRATTGKLECQYVWRA